jgi:hypothetical protein
MEPESVLNIAIAIGSVICVIGLVVLLRRNTRV